MNHAILRGVVDNRRNIVIIDGYNYERAANTVLKTLRNRLRYTDAASTEEFMLFFLQSFPVVRYCGLLIWHQNIAFTVDNQILANRMITAWRRSFIPALGAGADLLGILMNK